MSKCHKSVSSTSIEKSTPLQAKKSRGATFPPCYFDRKMSGASSPVTRRNTILKLFWWFLLMFYIGKLGKTSKIAFFRDLNPLNGVFGRILYPIPWGALLETFYAKFGKFSSSGRGDLKRRYKWPFSPFSPKMTYFDQIDTINGTFDQIDDHKPDWNNF